MRDSQPVVPAIDVLRHPAEAGKGVRSLRRKATIEALSWPDRACALTACKFPPAQSAAETSVGAISQTSLHEHASIPAPINITISPHRIRRGAVGEPSRLIPSSSTASSRLERREACSARSYLISAMWA